MVLTTSTERRVHTPAADPAPDPCAGLHVDPDVRRLATHGWQELLQHLAHGARRRALAEPGAFVEHAARSWQAPRPGLPRCGAAWTETVLTALCEDGFSDEAAVAAHHALACFLLGHLLVEVAAVQGGAQHPAPSALLGLPTTARLEGSLGADWAAAEFEEALEHLLDRIAAMRVER